jgi:AbrB family looped-hinge helix DNA binding protein
MLKFNETKSRRFVRVRERNQITLPAEIVAGLPIEVGDFLEINRTNSGLELKPIRLVTVGTPAAEREARKAEEEISTGTFESFKNAEAFKDTVRKRISKKRPAAAMMASD